jgi:hypothetical protein
MAPKEPTQQNGSKIGEFWLAAPLLVISSEVETPQSFSAARSQQDKVRGVSTSLDMTEGGDAPENYLASVWTTMTTRRFGR